MMRHPLFSIGAFETVSDDDSINVAACNSERWYAHHHDHHDHQDHTKKRQRSGEWPIAPFFPADGRGWDGGTVCARKCVIGVQELLADM